MENKLTRVLLVDDDEDDYVFTRDMLREIGQSPYDLEWISDYEKALERILQNQHDIYLIDYRLGQRNGLELLREAISRGCLKPIILLTGQGDHQVDVMAMGAGASDYLIKGKIDANLLERSIRYSIKHKNAEMQLARSEQAHRRLIEALPEGVAVVDHDENIIFINPAGCKIFGYDFDEMIGKNLKGKISPASWEMMVEETRKRISGLSSQYEIEIIKKGGAAGQILVSATPYLEDGAIVGAIGGFTDVTELRSAEREKAELRDKLTRAQRMESLGILAGGVAHDLNNILGPLVAYPQMILMNLSEEAPIRDKVQKIQRSAERAAEVVQDLLTLARRGRYEMAPLDINAVIDSYIKSPDFAQLSSRFPAVKFEISIGEELTMVNGSSSHLYKIVMNLALNAVEAMPGGGNLKISSRLAYVERLVSGFDNIEAGNYIILRVADTGTGIEEKDLKRIFEPFFSKKHMGKSGSGLGLAIVYGIVKDHNGYIDVISSPGVGTEFIVYIPATDQKKSAFNESSVMIIHGSEEILVVDDVAEQRELAATVLDSLGYRVHTAANGHEALAFMASGGHADVVVLDMIMESGFDGLDTYREILKLNPGQRAIITSGFAETDRVKEAQRLGVGKYIRKPYTMQVLGKAIRKVIEAEPTDHKEVAVAEK